MSSTLQPTVHSLHYAFALLHTGCFVYVDVVRNTVENFAEIQTDCNWLLASLKLLGTQIFCDNWASHLIQSYTFISNYAPNFQSWSWIITHHKTAHWLSSNTMCGHCILNGFYWLVCKILRNPILSAHFLAFVISWCYWLLLLLILI